MIRDGIFAEPVDESLPRYARDEIAFVQASAAAALAVPRSAASHGSGAALLKLPSWQPPSVPCLTTLPAATGDVAGVHLHRNTIGSEWGVVGALRVTSPARTIFDVTAERGIVEGVVAADAALRRGLLDRADLARVVAAQDRQRGVVNARRVLAFADPLSESPLESVSRWRFTEFDLPPPIPQCYIFVDGRFVGRVDFYWDEFGVFGEADGWGKYGADDEARRLKFREERRRQPALERADGIVER